METKIKAQLFGYTITQIERDRDLNKVIAIKVIRSGDGANKIWWRF